MNVLSAATASAEPAPRGIDAVRREFRRSREASAGRHDLDDAALVLDAWLARRSAPAR